ncbi:DUF1559 domain-containing protein [Planctomycetes bacterium K23_9]|uniref:DUF1559 domain-containing protein n=1 Tax=Stieleria marina TaxID=1930275 RepID=A0A517NP43_9BACT|nr:hypothetical protein K239x_08260 [Planctomycetes bacterium K23_9]
MPFLFTCPHCRTQTQVEDQYSGRSGECVTCGKPIDIPRFAPKRLGSGKTGLSGATKPFGWIVAASVALVLLGCLVFAVFRFGGQTVQRLSSNRTRNASIRNLEKIAAALNAYAAEHKTYPPPALLDANGKPLLSWRVLILPYLDEDELYDKFDLTKDWTSEPNMQIVYEMPAVFRHPDSQGGFTTPESDYYLVVGANTLFPPKGPMSPDKIVDSPTQTLLVIEGNPSVPTGMWTEPIDLDFAKMSGQINGSRKDDPGQLLEDGAAMATVDGRGHFLSDDTAVTVFNALVTPAGGEPLPDDTLD